MSSMFDSAVYQLQKSAPFTAPRIAEFMATIASDDMGNGEVKFACHYRHSVASRVWWTMEWQQNGHTYSVSAQRWELCLWRAIHRYKLSVREAELEEHVSKGSGWNPAVLRGWIDGDGI